MFPQIPEKVVTQMLALMFLGLLTLLIGIPALIWWLLSHLRVEFIG